MATIKSYTSVEQSRKLAEILPLESADMLFQLGEDKYADSIRVPLTKEHWEQMMPDIKPCWSLSALLGVLPQTITKYIESERCQKTFHLNLFRSYYHCVSYSVTSSVSDDDDDNTLYCIGRDNWIDACYEMIIKLHKNELNI